MKYEIKSSDLLRHKGVTLYYTRGILRNVLGGEVITWLKLDDVSRDDIQILMSACDACIDLERPFSFWVTLDDLDTAEGVIECECGARYLHPVICSGSKKFNKVEAIK